MFDDVLSNVSGTSNSIQENNPFTTVAWSKDVVKLSTTSDFVVDFLALNHNLIEKAQLVKINCGFIKDYPFLMHNGVIIDWVCNNDGEHLVTMVMMHVFRMTRKG